MYYSYYFCCRADAELLSFLKDNAIAHKIDDYKGLVPTLVSFTLKDSSPLLQRACGYADKSPIVSAHYSSRELSSADYLRLWPCRQSIDIVNEDEAYISQRCAGGKIHFHAPSPSMRIRKEAPANGHCAFWTHNTGFALLFADSRIKTLCEKEDLKGISFETILLKNGECAESLFLLDSPYKLPLEAVAAGHGERAYKCSHCGRIALAFTNSYTLHLKAASIPGEADFCMTEPFWGEGFAFPFYMISQRFYRLLKEQGLTGGIKLSPVIFESGPPV